VRLLAPEEALDVIQELPEPERAGILSLLDDKTRRGVKGLMNFIEERSRGLINQHYVRLRPDMTVDEAVSFLRRDARDRAQMTYYAYVTDPEERLLGVVSFRDLLITPGDRKVQDVMRTDVITAPEDVDAAELMGLFRRYNLQMIPLLDSERRIKRMVTREEIGDDVRARA
jgi:magnesium transporter